MSAIANTEVSSCTNPVITFIYQENGLLMDVVALSCAVFSLVTGTRTSVVADTALNVAACPTGQRLGIGRYVAPVDPTTPAAWASGTYEIVWTYQVVATGPTRTFFRRFEVIDGTIWPSGRLYTGYLDSRRAQDMGLTIPAGGTVTTIQRELETASREVEALTGRFFEPRYETLRFSSKGERSLKTGEVVIAIEEIGARGLSSVDTEIREVIDLDLIEVFNRHLRGALNPDDRDDPKVAYAIETDPTLQATFETLEFPAGTLNIDVIGVFGYTDPDGTPCGQTPQPLQRAVAMIAQRNMTDPLGEDPSSTSSLRSYRTRDQSISFMTPSDTGGASAGGTGVVRIDTILARYHRPFHLGATGMVKR